MDLELLYPHISVKFKNDFSKVCDLRQKHLWEAVFNTTVIKCHFGVIYSAFTLTYRFLWVRASLHHLQIECKNLLLDLKSCVWVRPILRISSVVCQRHRDRVRPNVLDLSRCNEDIDIVQISTRCDKLLPSVTFSWKFEFYWNDVDWWFCLYLLRLAYFHLDLVNKTIQSRFFILGWHKELEYFQFELNAGVLEVFVLVFDGIFCDYLIDTKLSRIVHIHNPR